MSCQQAALNCNVLYIVHVFDELAKVTRGESCACASLSK